MTRRAGRLDLQGENDLQAGVVRGISHPHAQFLFVRIDRGSSDAARQLLRSLLPEVTGAGHWGNEKPMIVRNVALSAAGLRALGVPAELIDVFGPAFGEGMRARAEYLGDTGPRK